jgi:TonB-linked SusC/RagA family outer membrane protein
MKKILFPLLLPLLFQHYISAAQESDSVQIIISDTVTTREISCGLKVITKYIQPILSRKGVSVLGRVLDGEVTGLQTTNGGGQPGASPEFLIRGMGSLEGSNKPLILLDNAPYFGSISSLNPQDILSVIIFKDAIATLPYGSRGANGVIKITIKNGAEYHEGKLNIDARFGITTRGISDYNVLKNEKDFYETMYSATNGTTTADQFIQFLGGYNPYNVPNSQLLTPDGKINPMASLKYHDDWSKELQRTGLKHDYNLSYSDKGKRGNYYVSAGYLNEQGYIKHTGFERFNATFNGDVKITTWLMAGLNSTLSIGKQRFIQTSNDYSNPFAVMRNMAPIYPVYYYNATGEKEIDSTTGTPKYDIGAIADYPQSSMGSRPYGYGTNMGYSLASDNIYNKNSTQILNPYIEVTLLKQFTFNARLHYNNNHNEEVNELNPSYGTGIKNIANADGKTYTINQTLSWKPSFNNHHLKVTAAHENYKLKEEYDREAATSSGTPTGKEHYQNMVTLEGYHAIAEYDFKSKYYLSAGFRRDGTSMLAPADRWNNFWAVSAGYAIHEELFLKDVSWINLLKLRFSYGVQGSNSMPANYYPFQTIDYGYTTPNINLIKLSSDKYRQWNAGIDLTIIDYRINATIDLYRRLNTKAHLFATTPWPGQMKIEGLEIANQGVELSLSTDLIRSYKVQWTTRLNLTHNVNKVTAMPEFTPQLYKGFSLIKEGNSLYDFYLPEYAGVDANTGLALYYKNDVNGQRIKTSDYGSLAITDYKNAGSIFPKVYGSLSNTISWKQFDFSLKLNFGIGGKYYDQVYQKLMGSGYEKLNWHTDITNHWTPENTATDIPRVNIYDVYANATSSRFIKDASYLNIKNIYLAYNFSESKLKSIKLKALSIYLTADNVWLFSARKGMDPQATFNGTPGNVYAPARTIMLGLHVGL